MSWEKRNGKGSYYTRSRRLGKRVVREYFGKGARGQAAAEEDEVRRRRQAQEKAETKHLAMQLSCLENLEDDLELCSQLVLLLESCKADFPAITMGSTSQSHERNDMSPNQDQTTQQTLTENEIKAILGRAQNGDKDCIDQLHLVLKQLPDLWRKYGNLRNEINSTWAHLVSEKDLLKRKSVERVLHEIRESSKGTGTAVELLLAEQLALLWVKKQYFERALAVTFLNAQSTDSFNTNAVRFFEKSLEFVMKQLVTTAKELSSITSIQMTLDYKQAKMESLEKQKQKVQSKRNMPRRIFKRMYPSDKGIHRSAKDEFISPSVAESN